jgi:hypothetical protein
MKFLLFVSTTLFCLSSNAQSIQVTEEQAAFSNGAHNALVTTIYQNDKEVVVEKWKDYLKDFKNDKVGMSNDEMIADNVIIKEWGTSLIDIYTLFEENKEAKTVKMKVAFDIAGVYVSSGSDTGRYPLAEKMLRDFALTTTKNSFEVKMLVLQKALEELTNNQKDLEKDNKSMRSDIEDYKKQIAKSEEEIKKNEEQQLKNKEQIAAQSSLIDGLKKDMEGVK